MRAAVVTLLALAALVACGSDGPGDSGTAPPPTFTEVRDDILLTSCGISTCHKPNPTDDTLWASESELVLDPDDPDAIYDDIVNATAATGKLLIVPNDPDGSFLITKVQGAQGPDEGDEMPPNGFGLDADTTAIIVAWVEDGAPNN